MVCLKREKMTLRERWSLKQLTADKSFNPDKVKLCSRHFTEECFNSSTTVERVAHFNVDEVKRDARKFVKTNNDWNILAENNSSVTVGRLNGQHMDMTLVINSQDFAVEMSAREKTSFEGKRLSAFVKKIPHQTICPGISDNHLQPNLSTILDTMSRAWCSESIGLVI